MSTKAHDAYAAIRRDQQSAAAPPADAIWKRFEFALDEGTGTIDLNGQLKTGSNPPLELFTEGQNPITLTGFIFESGWIQTTFPGFTVGDSMPDASNVVLTLPFQGVTARTFFIEPFQVALKTEPQGPDILFNASPISLTYIKP